MLRIADFEIAILFREGVLVKVDLQGQIPEGVAPVFESQFVRIREALEEYFYGERDFPEYTPYRLEVPDFTRRCLEFLRTIPRGEVCTYGWVARQLGYPRGARAVGQALARNPLPLFFPCHRVVGRHSLGGFSAGLDLKRRLLRLEGLRI